MIKIMRTFSSKEELKNAIKEQITSSDAQAVKAMLRIFEYQTEDEQQCGTVCDYNGVGFVGTDAEILTSFCNQYEAKGYLSPKQMVIVRKKVGKYAGQLMKQAINNGLYVKQDGQWQVAVAA